MSTENILLVVAENAAFFKPFRARLRAEREFLKTTRIVFTDSKKALEFFETENSGGSRVCGGFLDLSAQPAQLHRVHAAQQKKLVNLDHRTSWVLTYEPGIQIFREAERIFGSGVEQRWDILEKPFSKNELLHKAARLLKLSNEDTPVPSLFAVSAERSERLAVLGQLARGIGHEFGNILLKISGRAELALNEEDLELAKGHLAIISSAAERGGLIVRNLQSLSKSVIRPEPLAPAAIIEEALIQSLHVTKSRSIEVVKKYAAVAPVIVDKRAIIQVFTNVVLNAIDAMPNGGRLELRVASAGTSHVAISVSDSGTGIPAEILPRIFEFAFTTKGDRGTGLGLSISKQVIEAHLGEIQVQTRPGHGTRFTVLLPVASSK
ncbi:MAG: hypothetical protein A2X94_05700 [Bdellovibrionales bacterium GWB1_55_8]|nr:MAG: hypothetical protein A2X94_05700 [Bdellovibrionales bacterium GWB1_55_8]